MDDAMAGFGLLCYRVDQLEEWRESINDLIISLRVWLKVATVSMLFIHPVLVAIIIREVV